MSRVVDTIYHNNAFGRCTPPKRHRYKYVGRRFMQCFTIVLRNLPTYEEAVDMVTKISSGGSNKLSLLCGVAILHPEDNYSRKVGVSVAVNNLSAMNFEFDRVLISQDAEGRMTAALYLTLLEGSVCGENEFCIEIPQNGFARIAWTNAV